MRKNFMLLSKFHALALVNTKKMVISDKFKHSNKDFQNFAGYSDDDIIRSLWIVLPRMSGYINYFNNDGKNMASKIEDGSVLVKYNIWNQIKEMKGMKFHSIPVYDEKYIKV